MISRCSVRQQCLLTVCHSGASSGKINFQQAIPEGKSRGHPKSLMVTDQTGRIWAVQSGYRTKVPETGRQAGRNNSNLALCHTPVACSEMGTISNDGSHFVFGIISSLQVPTLQPPDPVIRLQSWNYSGYRPDKAKRGHTVLHFLPGTSRWHAAKNRAATKAYKNIFHRIISYF
jgi:hypothetical protein